MTDKRRGKRIALLAGVVVVVSSRLLTIVIPLLLCSGCMSIITQVMYFTEEKYREETVMTYSGTQANVLFMKTCVTEGPFEPVGCSPFRGICGFLDFFQSLAMDTVLLPLTIGQEIYKSSRSSQQEEVDSDASVGSLPESSGRGSSSSHTAP